VIIFNGLQDQAALTPYEDLLFGIRHEVFFTRCPTQDIPAYFSALRSFPAEYVCFLNSYSVILHHGWLRCLYEHASRDGVGLVGATGSWESRLSSYINGAAWPLAGERPIHLLDGGKRLLRRLRMRSEARRLRKWFQPFPNPHLRSNAFMLSRKLMLSLEVGHIRYKVDAERFESGRNGLTRQVLDRGLDALVVGRDGAAYRAEQWPQSRTFRSADNRNLLVADNRTEQYLEADCATRATLEVMAWGEISTLRISSLEESA
jgi:hypothetical protein